jgi:outer membrane protein assembly factor BamC
MKKITALPLVVAVSITVSGCGWLFGDKGIFHDRGDNYRQAQVEKPLEIPAGLSKTDTEEDFAIPSIAYSAPLEGKFQVPRPQPLDGSPEAEQVKIQILNGASWILVEASPGEVWPRVRQFLNTNQLGVARIDATAGVIETSWLQPQAEGAPRERYRFRIEQGVQRGSAEVYVLQENTAPTNAAAGEQQWPQASSDHARETEMIKAVAQFIADNGSTGAVSMLAQRGIESRGKVALNKQAGANSYLRLELPFDRAWASLDAAVQRAGFTVEDRNRSAQELLVRFTPPADPEDQKSWWGKFWSWVFSSDEEVISEKDILQVKMQPVAGTDNAVRIDLQRENGKPLKAAIEEDLLNRIKNKLS